MGNGDDGVGEGLTWPMQRRDNGYGLNRRIIIAAIVSLSVVVFIVALLHIYARYVLRRQARRRAAIHELGLWNAMQWQARVEPPKRGLDPSVLAGLPVYAFRRDGVEDVSTVTAECTVCLSALEEGELTRSLPNCKHTFHAECIDRWFGSHTTCPLCRMEAEPLAQPVQGEAASDAAPTAPPLEGTSDGGIHPVSKVSGSSSRFSSFRRILSREISSRRLPSCGQPDDVPEDLERQ